MSSRGKGGTESSRAWSCIRIRRAVGEKLDNQFLVALL